MRNPSASDTYAQLPRREWFDVMAAIDVLYPDMPNYYKPIINCNIHRRLRKEMKWGNVARLGDSISGYQFMILEGCA